MSIACQSREVVAGPTVAFQVGGQGDGSGYIRQQQQQQQQQQDAVIRGLSCISIYRVHSNSEGKSPVVQTDTSSLRALGVHEMFRPKDDDISQERQVGLTSTKNVGPGDELGSSCALRSSACPVEQFEYLAAVREEEMPSGGFRCREGGQLRPKDSMVTSSSTSDDDSLSTCTDDDDEASGDMEVEGKLKGPLDSMAALEDSLPIKRGLSNFFSGKSRSFTCLADVVSVKDLAKPESPYNRRKRALLGCGNNWERNRFYPPRNSTAGISKKPMHSSKSTLALAVAMSKSDDSLESDERDLHLPPLPPQGKWQRSFASPRSFSLTDLQGV